MTTTNENRIIKAFEKEVDLTEQGLIELTETKGSLVFDLSTKQGMTAARKERTERNKLIEQVKRVSIDTEKAIKAKRESIIENINNAFKPIIEPLEKELQRQKEEAERLAVKEAERIAGIKEQIQGLHNFLVDIKKKNSQELSDIIEAVDLIDVNESFAEFTQEALQVKKEVLATLNIELSGIIEREKLEAERVLMKAQERLNNLKMIPVTMMGIMAFEIKAKIEKIEAFPVQESEFGELFQEAEQARIEVINQLNTMYSQTKFMEDNQPEEPKAEQEIKQPAEQPVQERLAERFKEVPDEPEDGQEPLTPKENLLSEVAHWANVHGVSFNSVNELNAIIDKYI